MKKILSLIPALFLACFLSVSSATTSSALAQTEFDPGFLGKVGDTATFNIQAGEWKGKKGVYNENFVGTYEIAKVGTDQFSIDYEAFADENYKVELNDVKIWVNDTGKFLTSPGNQKGKAFAVEPGETFTFTGDQMYVFIHFVANYYEKTNKGWKRTGEDSATGYDPEGRISKGNWFMYNTVAVPKTIWYTVYYITIYGELLDCQIYEANAGDIVTLRAPYELYGYTLLGPMEIVCQPNDGDEFTFIYNYRHILM